MDAEQGRATPPHERIPLSQPGLSRGAEAYSSPPSTPPARTFPVPYETRRIVVESTPLLDSDRRSESRRQMVQDSYILGCSVLAMTLVVILVFITGVTKFFSNSNAVVMQVYSTWENDGIIPRKHGCQADGEAVSMPVTVKNIPKNAISLFILLANPHVIDEVGYDPVYWFVTEVPVANKTELIIPEGSSTLPAWNKYEQENSWREKQYRPVCGRGMFILYVYAVEAPGHVESFRDARAIMNRLGGEPVAMLHGLYKHEGL